MSDIANSDFWLGELQTEKIQLQETFDEKIKTFAEYLLGLSGLTPSPDNLSMYTNNILNRVKFVLSSIVDFAPVREFIPVLIIMFRTIAFQWNLIQQNTYLTIDVFINAHIDILWQHFQQNYGNVQNNISCIEMFNIAVYSAKQVVVPQLNDLCRALLRIFKIDSRLNEQKQRLDRLSSDPKLLEAAQQLLDTT